MAILAALGVLALPAVATATHVPATSWGAHAPDTPGDGAGELKDPSGIAVDAFDNVYVADYGNNRVQKFSADGELMSGWGANGAVSGFDQPVDVAVTESSELYVADRANDRIKRFSAVGTPIGEWAVDSPRAVATDDLGNVYVADPSDSVIRKFDANGAPVAPVTFGTTQYTGIDVAGTNVFVTDLDNDEVERWTTDGVFLEAWGATELDAPSDVAVTENGLSVFVADSDHDRVQAFTLSGTPLPHTLGASNGTLENPQGVATGSLDSVFVSDTEGGRVVKYSAPSSGSTVRLSGTRLLFAGDGSDSVVSVTRSGGAYTFTDTGDALTRGAGCTQISADQVTCDPSGVDVTALRFAMGAGDDEVTVGAGVGPTPALIDGGAGNDVLTGGSGANDVASYASAVGPVTVDLGTVGVPQPTGGAGDDTLSGFEGLAGGDFGDVLIGDAQANTLAGEGGGDTLRGGGGDDAMTGGAGTDSVDYATATSAVTVDLSVSGPQATGGAGGDTIAGVENLSGSGHADVLTGSSATNVISGAGGDDTIHVRDSGADQANCGTGADTVTADSHDVVAGDCESVTRDAPGTGTGAGTGVAGPVAGPVAARHRRPPAAAGAARPGGP